MQIFATHGPELIVMACMLACSAFFNLTEASLFSLTREQLRRLEAAPSLVGNAISGLLKSRTDLLVTILLGNTIVDVLYFAVSFNVAFKESGRSMFESALFGGGSFLALIFLAEVIPKGVAVRRPRAASVLVSLPMRGFHALAKPIRMLLTPLSRRSARMLARRPDDSTYVSAEELKMLVELSHQQGIIHGDVRRMMKGVVGLGNRLVKEVMVPRTDVGFFDLAKSKDEFIDLVIKTRHKRFPAYEGSPDNIVGLIHAADVFLHPDKDIREILRPAVVVPETKTIESMLHEFRETRRQTAVVVDEYGGVVGLITMEDILEEVVGEIRDEFEPHEPAVKMVGHNTYEVSGQMSTRMWRDIFGISIAAPDFNTLGGFVISLLGRVPREGDSVQYAGFEFTAESVRRNRIRRLKVRIPEGEADISRALYE